MHLVNVTSVDGFVISVMDHKYKSLLQNIPTRHMIVKADQENGEAQLKRLRERDIFNYFIIGRLTTITNVLDSADANDYFQRQFAWHGITAVSSELQLDYVHKVPVI
jgi:ionotropic glutamate receptor